MDRRVWRSFVWSARKSLNKPLLYPPHSGLPPLPLAKDSSPEQPHSSCPPTRVEERSRRRVQVGGHSLVPHRCLQRRTLRHDSTNRDFSSITSTLSNPDCGEWEAAKGRQDQAGGLRIVGDGAVFMLVGGEEAGHHKMQADSQIVSEVGIPSPATVQECSPY